MKKPYKPAGAYEALWLIYIVCCIATALLMMAGCTKSNYESCVDFHKSNGYSTQDISQQCFGTK